MVAVVFSSPLLLQTRVAHITCKANSTHEVHITCHRRIELVHLLYCRCTVLCVLATLPFGGALHAVPGTKRPHNREQKERGAHRAGQKWRIGNAVCREQKRERQGDQRQQKRKAKPTDKCRATVKEECQIPTQKRRKRRNRKTERQNKTVGVGGEISRKRCRKQEKERDAKIDRQCLNGSRQRQRRPALLGACVCSAFCAT